MSVIDWPNRSVRVPAGKSAGIAYNQNFALVGTDGVIFAYIYPFHLGTDHFMSNSLDKEEFKFVGVGTRVVAASLTSEEAKNVREKPGREEALQRHALTTDPDFKTVLDVNRKLDGLVVDWERSLADLRDRLRGFSRETSKLEKINEEVDVLCRKIQEYMAERSRLRQQIESGRGGRIPDSDKGRPSDIEKRYQDVSKQIVSHRRELGRSIERFSRTFKETIGVIIYKQSDRSLSQLQDEIVKLDELRKESMSDLVKRMRDDSLERIDKQANQVGMREVSLRDPFRSASADLSEQESSIATLLVGMDALLDALKMVGDYYRENKEAVFAQVNSWLFVENDPEKTLSAILKYPIRTQKDLLTSGDWQPFGVYGQRSLEEFTRTLVAGMNDTLIDWLESNENLADRCDELLGARIKVEEVWSQVQILEN